MAIHHFTPTTYHLTLGSHEPVLHIADGDTVITSTVDAHGLDAQEAQVADRGNPMTGPFFVDGAEPGDTLVVHLDDIVPNRTFGWARTTVAANVLDPEFLRETSPADWEPYARWRVDLDAQTVSLVDPAATGLSGLTLPLEPMVGCFGVAPANGQAISTATSAQHGGNMDYRGFTVGTAAHFPVFVSGALFHIGDCHARQSDGEIAGTGVEISCSVRFTVRVLKAKTILWPAGENDRYLFTVGNARPLDQAVQHATTAMLYRLQHDYGLASAAAQTLMGQTVEYDVANVYDPAYTMVCKIQKRNLPPQR